MSTNSRWWFADLFLALVLAGAGGYAAYVGIGGRPRVALVLPLVVFLPGYAFISALFPEGGEDEGRVFGNDKDAAYALGGPERVGLAVTVSVAIVPMVAAVANFTPWGIRLRPILVGVLGFTAFFILLAFARRWRVPSERRYTPGLPGLLFNSAGRRSGSTTTTVLNVGIVISFLLVASTVGFAVLNPPQGEQFTEFYVDTNNINSSTNTLYETDLGNDGVTVNIANHEGERTKYTVVAVLQRVENGKVVEESQFAEKQVTVGAGQTKKATLTGDPSISGDNVRLRLLLYKGNPSGQPYIPPIRLWLSSQEAPQQTTTGGGNDGGGDTGGNDGGNGDGGDGNDGGDGGEQTTQPPETSTTTTTSSGTTSTTTTGTTTAPGTTTTTSGTTTTQTGGTTTTGTATTTDDGILSRDAGYLNGER